MKIELQKIKIKDLTKKYSNDAETGSVVGFNGQLNIRPSFQREFVYKDKQREEVIHTIRKSFPLNIFYWSKNRDGSFEMLDGQQRTISACDFVNGIFSINENGNRKFFNTLAQDEKETFLNYELQVYICEGTESEKLEWFKTINIAGEKLTDQELLNATYTGPWLSDAKLKFSKQQGQAYQIGQNYLTGSPIRQDYLEEALNWISRGEIDTYMARHQHDFNANELWTYFSSVITWVKTNFTNYRREMKGIPWGRLYNDYKDKTLNPTELETRISTLMQDEEVTSRKGIYVYLLTNDEKWLSLRTFSEKDKRAKYEEQKGICPICGNHFEYEEMQGDHNIPWSRGGKTNYDNLVMLCTDCNRKKSNQ
jgi:hypothetical protein